MNQDVAIMEVRSRLSDLDSLTYPETVDTTDIVAKSAYQASDGTLKFTDLQILGELKHAVQSLCPDYTLETLPESREFIVVCKAVISCLRGLAVREARNYRISVDGISIAKSERVTNYLAVALAMEQELNREIASLLEVEVADAKRYNVRVNKVT